MSKYCFNKLKASELSAYELLKIETLSEINSEGYVFRHKKSGARVAVVFNDDNNKVFNIGFRTPPEDSTGVAHIIEHTVLCGSKKYPAKDPFIELAKGSMNTFLNAITYPDKTLYPVASCNDKDFQNLINVYMDAVFYPNIYEHREIFEQEGWHYELETPEGELIYNGVVYNEMKGALSSPESLLSRRMKAKLYPDICYSVESGGDPDCIPKLTYENYLEFHRKYYHPSNSYIILYGDMDVTQKLEWMDKEYLSKFTKIDLNSEIVKQPKFEKISKSTIPYPVGSEEDTNKKTFLSCAYSIGSSTNQELCIAFSMLEQVLLSNPGAPLKQAILDANIGDDVTSSFDTELCQPMLTIKVKNSEHSKLDELYTIIQKTLKQLVSEGLDQKSIRAALSKMSFEYREADFHQYPKGLMYSLQMLATWLYDDNEVFSSFYENQMIEALKSKNGTGYFEELIQTYLIDNTHCALLALTPEKGLNQRKDESLKKELAAYKASLSEEEIQKIIEATIQLKKYQEEPSTIEELESIPMLTREDMEKNAMPLSIHEYDEAGIKLLHHDYFTNGIVYLKLLFKLDHCPKEYVPYLGLLNACIGYVNTGDKTFLEFANDISIETGGISTSVQTFGKRGSSKEYTPVLSIDVKALYEQLPKAMELIVDMITKGKLNDTKRLEEIVLEIKSRLHNKLITQGHVAAIERAFSYYSEEAYFEQQVRGINYFQFLNELYENWNDRKEELVDILEKLLDYVFRKENLILSVTCPEDGFKLVRGEVEQFVSHLSTKQVEQKKLKLDPVVKNEGFQIPGQIQYVASVGNIFDSGFSYTGALRVLKTIMSYNYLWNNVRVKGGAYGCMCNFSGVDGNSYYVSYRDPNLLATKKVYEQASDFVRNFTADERELTKYIIGTMSSMDTPLMPAAKGSRSLGAYMVGTTFEDIQKERDQVISASVEEIQALADLVDCIGNSNYFCVIGNETKLIENKDLFLTIEPLSGGKKNV